MQARGGLIQDVECVAACRARQLRRELHPLRLPARERRRRLPEPQVAEAQLAERAQDARRPRLAAEQRRRLLECGLEEVVNRPPAVLDRQRLVVEAPAAARLADDVHLAEEVHADLLDAGALARFASPARDVEREAPLSEPPRARLRQRREQVADDVGEAGVRRRVGPGRPADRRLVHVDDLADPAFVRGPSQPVDELLHQARLACSRHAGDHVERAEQELDVDPIEVVPRRPLQPVHAGARAARCRHVDTFVARQERARPAAAIRPADESRHRPAVEQFTAVRPGTRPDVDQPVRPPHRLVVVLDHQHGVAAITKRGEDVQQALLLHRVQTDRRLVEHVQHPAEVGAHLGRQAQALRFTAGEGGGRAVERQVIESESRQQVDASPHLRADRFTDRRLGRRELERGKEIGERVDRPCGQFADVAPAEENGQRLRPEARAAARLAREAAHEPEDVAVPAPRENLLHHREDALVDPLLPGPGGDAAPAEARRERVLAVRNPDAVGPVEHDVPLLVGERLPRRVDVEAVRPTHLVEDVDGHLRVDDVAGRRRNHERALPDGPAAIGDEQVRVEPVLDAEALAGRARAVRRIEREQATLDAETRRRRAQAGVEQAQVVVQARQRADRGSRVARGGPLIDGDRRREAVDRAHHRPRHAPEELPGIRRERLEIAALRLAADRVECERGLAGPRHAGDDRDRPARDLDVDRLEVVLARAAHREHGHGRHPTARASRSPNASSATGSTSSPSARNCAKSCNRDGAPASSPVSSSRTVCANSPKCARAVATS